MTSPNGFSDIVADPTSKLLVIAPPGCGKTELLARRAAVQLETLGPHERILALTFSNRAKANLNDRLVRVLGAERKRRHVRVHNFHGHAAEIIRSHGKTLGIDPRFIMPDKNTLGSAIEPFLDGLSEADAGALRANIEGALRDAKQSPVDDAQVLRVLERIGIDAALTIERQRQLTATLHYDDLLRHAQRLLRVEAVGNLYRLHYHAMLVDEFQDLSPQQLEIALLSCDTLGTFVGDPLQGIYSWTGARPIEVEARLRELCGPPRGIGVSYRSSPAVLGLMDRITSLVGGRELVSFEPDDWYEGGIAAGGIFETGHDEAVWISDAAVSILAGAPKTTIGVICRSGWRRRPIDRVFAERGIPCIRWDLAIENSAVLGILRSALARVGSFGNLDDLCEMALGGLETSDVETYGDIVEAVDKLRPAYEEYGSLIAVLSQLRTPGDGLDPIEPGVHLLNAHTGKGQQFDWVFIPGLEEGNVPSFLARTKDAIEEELRVLLVMVSRARHGVILTRARSLVSKRGFPYSTSESRWAEELRSGFTASRDEVAKHILGYLGASVSLD